jgi:hypothetical protein
MTKIQEEIETYNVYVRESTEFDVYDVRVPELYPGVAFEIEGAYNAMVTIQECCILSLQKEEFHLFYFSDSKLFNRLIKDSRNFA